MTMPLSESFMESYRSCCGSSKTRLKVKTMAQDKCLEFNADRLEPEDWAPFIKALKTDRRLHSLVIKSDYTDRGKPIRKYSSTETLKPKPAFHRISILNDLVEAVVTCMKRSPILSTVQLQALPLNNNHLKILANGIEKCRSLQNLVLTCFQMGDAGLAILYEAIYKHTGINLIDFTDTGITPVGARIIAKLIHVQRLARYDETWKQSLRYREPDQELFPGIRRITINDNPEIADCGYLHIIHELMDDLWVKALDIQNCGLTMTSANQSMELIRINEVLEVLDLSRNCKITTEVKRQIKDILVSRAVAGERNRRGYSPSSSYATGTSIATKPVINKSAYGWLENKSDLTYTKSRGSYRVTNSDMNVTRTRRPQTQSSRLNRNSSHLVDLNQPRRNFGEARRFLSKESETLEEIELAKKRNKAQIAGRIVQAWNKRKQAEKQIERLKDELRLYQIHGFLPKNNSPRTSLTVSTIPLKKIKSFSTSNNADKTIKLDKRMPKNRSKKSVKPIHRSPIKLCYKTVDKKEIENPQPIKEHHEMVTQNIVEPMDQDDDPPKEPVPEDRHIQEMPKEEIDSMLVQLLKQVRASSNTKNVNFNTNDKTDLETSKKEKHARNRGRDMERDLRDMSPMSRSQWIFNRVMVDRSEDSSDARSSEEEVCAFKYVPNPKPTVKI